MNSWRQKLLWADIPSFEVDNDAFPSGSSLKGYINTTYDNLVSKLGPPKDIGDSKARVEWIVKYKNSTRESILTIYDWKEDIPIEEVTEWHVGGTGDAYNQAEQLAQFLGTTFVPWRIR
ncbi:MAG: hypothetical protein M0R03_14500 [Novosphingobium sp.]|nr:hypothetical protein [Novosphingobium sp.]